MKVKAYSGIPVYTMTGKVYIKHDIALKKSFLEKLENTLEDDEELVVIPAVEIIFIKKYPETTVLVKTDTTTEIVLMTIEDLIGHMRCIAGELRKKNAGEKHLVELTLV